MADKRRPKSGRLAKGGIRFRSRDKPRLISQIVFLYSHFFFLIWKNRFVAVWNHLVCSGLPAARIPLLLFGTHTFPCHTGCSLSARTDLSSSGGDVLNVKCGCATTQTFTCLNNFAPSGFDNASRSSLPFQWLPPSLRPCLLTGIVMV